MAVQHFRACADVEKSRYSFFVELDGVMPTQERLVQLLHELDASLRVLNVEYAQKRESRRLDAPVLCVMKSAGSSAKPMPFSSPGRATCNSKLSF